MRRLGPWLYGGLFCLALPGLLVLWAYGAGGAVGLPVPGGPATGAGLAASGFALLAWGIATLAREGRGLPMNAFPPPRLAVGGAYALVPHPIYAGFVLAVAGASILARSAAGLWLVTPAVALGSAALVLGYEGRDLRARLGTPRRALLSLPPADGARPSVPERLAVLLLTLGPWLLLYEAFVAIGPPSDAVDATLPFERGWPVLEWTEAPYAALYAIVPLVPFAVGTRRELRRFAIGGLLGTLLGVLAFASLPLIAPPRPFEPTSALGRLLALERAKDTPAAAFPSFHVFWALLAADLLGVGSRPRRLLAAAGGIAVAASCVTTGQHALLDVVGGAALFGLVRRPERLAEAFRRSAEVVANSWTETRWGPVRLVGPGLYGALAAFGGTLLAGTLAPATPPVAFVVVAGPALAGAALWAQAVEGSPALSRPFGYYGAILGAALALPATRLAGADPWPLAAAFATSAPLVQAVGRLRCLANGCCHGAPAERGGIRVVHPRSRVVRLAGLAGIPIHPTPAWSIAWNLLCVGPLLRLTSAGAPPSLVVGLYLLTNGLGRFVEEAHRGEPQTGVYAGLRLYQWLAIASVAAGAVLTTIPTAAEGASAAPSPPLLVAAAAAALLAGFALGVDFPERRGRFSRLV